MDDLKKLREERNNLLKQQEELEKKIADAEECELIKARKKVSEKIENMSEYEKEIILKYMKHGRSSCSDDNPINGFFRSMYDNDREGWRCDKCMLMEILNGEFGGRYDFRLSVEIFEVKV